MVAYDPKRPNHTLSEETRAGLRSAMVRTLSVAGKDEGADLQQALRAAAAEARQYSLRPEELIIELKSILAAAARERPERSAVDEQRLKEWMVTVCLQAYYGKE